MKKLIAIATIILLTTPALAQRTRPASEEKELKKIYAKRLAVPENRVEAEIQKGAVNEAYQAVIDEIIERIRRQKVDEAKAYQPTQGEILTELQKRSAPEPVVE